MQYKISTKFVIAFAIVFSFIALQATIMITDIRLLNTKTDQANLYSQEIDHIHELQHSFLMLVMPANDYLITANKGEISTYNKAKELLESRFDKVYDFPLLASDEKIILDKAFTMFERIDSIALRIFAIEAPKNSAEGPALMEEMDALAEEANEVLGDYHKISHDELTNALNETNAWYSRMLNLTTLFSVFLLALLISLAFFLSRLIVEPVGKLTVAVKSLAEGQYAEVDIGRREDELGLLVKTFNNMSMQIKTSMKSINDYARKSEIARTRAVDREKAVRTMGEAGNIISSSIDTKEIIDNLLNFISTLTKAKSMAVFMYDKSTGFLESQWYSGFKYNDIAALKVKPGDNSTIANVFSSKNTLALDVTVDEFEDALKNELQKERLNYVVLIPLKARENSLGVVMLCDTGTKFKKRQIEYMQILANNVGSALNNALLHEEILEHEKKRQESEMAIAQKIQASLLPQSAPEFKGLEIGFFSKQARQVGGDFFDFIEVEDKLVTTIGDVSGKSVSAALLTSMIRYILKSTVNGSDTIGPISILNKVLTEETTPEVYTTLLYLLFDLKNARVHLLNAGHVQPLLYSAEQDKLSYVSSTPQLPLGIKKEFAHSDQVLDFKTGDFLVLYTDGIVEARARKSAELFGYDQLFELVRQNKELPAQEMVGEITKNIIQFSAGELKDDLALIVIKAT